MLLGIGLSLLIFVLFLFLGMPVYGTIFAALFTIIFLLDLPATLIPTAALFSLSSHALLAIPLFILMGDLMGKSGMATALVDFANALVGRVKGGLAHVLVMACLFFGTVTGSSLVTTVTIGSIMIPRMEEHGWNRRYAAALTAFASPLGFLIPPSILGILYAFVAQVSVGRIFLATVGPGIIMAIGIMIANSLWGIKYYQPVALPVADRPKGMAKELAGVTFRAFPALLAPLVILGGIYGGVFTATEASAIGVAYALLVGFVIYRGLRGRAVFSITQTTAITTAAVMLIIVPMAPYVRAMIMAGVGEKLINFVTGISENVYVILLMINVLFLILGMFIDPIPIMLAIVPLLIPLFKAIGVDPIHIGAVILFNMGLGTCTPPFALNIFAAARVSKLPFNELVGIAVFFVLTIGLPTLLLTTYIPQIALWLPNLIMGPGQ